MCETQQESPLRGRWEILSAEGCDEADDLPSHR
jgi:hypothetical protein